MRHVQTLLILCAAGGLSLWSAEAVAQQKKKKNGQSKKSESEESGEENDEEATATDPSTSLQRGSRMEFDGRLIRGQHAGAGAVFLFERVPRHLPSMVDKRRTYLRRTVRTVLGGSHAATFDEARRRAADLEEKKKAEDTKKKQASEEESDD